MTNQELIAKDLLSIQAVFLNPKQPFTWASGIKAPVYCDNRLTLSDPKVRYDVETSLANLIREKFPNCEALFGTATAGIAHAAITAYELNIPMGYVRTASKDHGRQNQIEGKLLINQKVVVVEDLISTAGSCVETVKVLREAGADVLGVVSIMTYGMQKAIDRFNEVNVAHYSLTNFDTIATIAAKEGYIEPHEINQILAFRDNPNDESWMEK